MSATAVAGPLLDPEPPTARMWPSAGRRRLLMIVVAAVGLVLLARQLPQVGNAASALTHARWQWLPTILVFSTVTYMMGAVALRGAASAPLPFGRTVVAQVAAAFTNRLAPAGIGGMATNVRFLELAGSTRTAAAAAVGLNVAAGFAVHVVAIAAVVPLLGGNALTRPADLWDGWPAAVAVLAGALLVRSLLRGRPRRRGRALMALAMVSDSVAAVVRVPRRLAALVLGSVGVTAGYALALVASVQALGGGVAPVRVVAVYLGASAVAVAAPTPGGLGALEAALVAGLTAAGAQGQAALGAVLVFRLGTYWMPVLPGWIAFRSLRAGGAL